MSFVIAFFTVELRRRRQFAAESQQRTATLYKLSQEIATTTKLDVLIPHLAQRFCEDFHSEGVNICALWLPQETEALAVCAISSADATLSPQHYDATTHQAHAALAFNTERIAALIEGTHARILVCVHDEGIGIPSGELETIFIKFHRLQQPLPWLPHDLPKGTGLGVSGLCWNHS